MDAQTREMWDREARTFDEGADHGLRDPDVRAAWRSLLLRALPAPPARVLDMGCGTGTLAALLAEESFDVTGVDASTEMLRAARTKGQSAGRTSYCQADASSPPFAEGCFDAVLCRHVLWALEEPHGALERWCRLLNSGGSVVLIEGRWETGAGIERRRAEALMAAVTTEWTVRRLDDPALWGGPIRDERYLLVGRSSTLGAG